jgi:hypothetical protein
MEKKIGPYIGPMWEIVLFVILIAIVLLAGLFAGGRENATSGTSSGPRRKTVRFNDVVQTIMI